MGAAWGILCPSYKRTWWKGTEPTLNHIILTEKLIGFVSFFELEQAVDRAKNEC